MGFEKLSDDDLDKVSGGVNIHNAVDAVIKSDYKSAVSEAAVDLTGIRSALPVSSVAERLPAKTAQKVNISDKLTSSKSIKHDIT